MEALMGKIKAWFTAQGGVAHGTATIWLALNGAYLAVPPFHQLVIDVWAKTPADVRQLGLAAAGLGAWYTSTRKWDKNP